MRACKCLPPTALYVLVAFRILIQLSLKKTNFNAKLGQKNAAAADLSLK
jgi:hypothetical protein